MHTNTHTHMQLMEEADAKRDRAINQRSEMFKRTQEDLRVTWLRIADVEAEIHRIQAICCSVLQCVAVCCSVLQCVAVLQLWMWRLRFIRYIMACCSVLQCVAVCCSLCDCGDWDLSDTGQCVAVCCSMLQCVAVCCSALQCVAVCVDVEAEICRVQARPYVTNYE